VVRGGGSTTVRILAALVRDENVPEKNACMSYILLFQGGLARKQETIRIWIRAEEELVERIRFLLHRGTHMNMVEH
jgi:hypothetical protein